MSELAERVAAIEAHMEHGASTMDRLAVSMERIDETLNTIQEDMLVRRTKEGQFRKAAAGCFGLLAIATGWLYR